MSEGIPEGWHETALGDVATVIMGQSPSSSTYNTEGVGLPFFQGKADFGNHHPVVRMWCSEPTKIAPADSILFSVRAPVGDVNITKDECCIGRGLSAIVGKKVDQSFLYQNLLFSKSKFQLLAQGSTFEAINGSEMREFGLLTPTKPEQQKIASILTSVDEVLEKTEAQISKLQDLKKGMMQELLTKGIGHTEFKDSPVGRIPVNWNIQLIKDICTHVVDCVNKTAPVVDYKTPFKMIRTTNVRNGKVDTDEVKFVTEDTYKIWTRRLIPKNGDLIFTREAPVGESGILRNSKGVFLGQRTMLYRADPGITNITYLMYSLHAEYCKKQLEDFSGGSTTPHMRVPDCEKILIKVPPIREQNRIASVLSSVDGKIDNLLTKKKKLESQKKGLMQDLLTGKVRVKVN